MMIVMYSLIVLLFVLGSTTIEGAQERLVGYLPRTQITDHAAIDLDQEKLMEQLALGRFTKAENIYEMGGHSGSYAELLLIHPNGAHNFRPGDKVVGFTQDMDEVVGTLRKPVDFEDRPMQEIGIDVAYDTSDIQSVYVDCQVGGLYTFYEANRAGCFNDSGLLSIFHQDQWNDFQYEYDIRHNNKAYRTLRSFSVNANITMRRCEVVCDYYPDFQLYRDFYGNDDYADRWVTAALGGNDTEFASGRGNAFFSGLRYRSAQAQAIQKGTAYMTIFMEVIKMLENAVAICERDCSSPDCEFTDPVQAVDQAVAFYAGSLEGEDGSGFGNLMYDLADWTALSFRTAGEGANEESGTSYANIEIIKNFKAAQLALIDDACTDAGYSKRDIVNLMKIPLIQGLLLYAYKRDYQHSDSEEIQEQDEAEGATFAATMLPYIHDCNPDDAEFVYAKMFIGSNPDDVEFDEIKARLEKNYECIGVTCAEIGGIWTASGYADGGEPCEDGSYINTASKRDDADYGKNDVSEDDGASIGFLVLASLVGAMGAVVIAMIFERRYGALKGNRTKQPSRHHPVRNIAAVSEIA